MKIDLKGLTLEKLTNALEPLSLPGFRARQIMRWIYSRDACDFSVMTDLPEELRTRLADGYVITRLTVGEERTSRDGTVKLLLSLGEDGSVEAVGIPEDSRLTVCFSTQVGCAMACGFCATGLGGFVRNLSAGEIIDQVQRIASLFGRRVTNAVAMGQGEPFANYDSTIDALRVMNSKDGLEIGARHLTISTCGIVSGIDRFSDEPEQFGLAVSLHSAIQEKRRALMPVVGHHPLASLKKACASYSNKTKRRITFEYAMIAGENDGSKDLEALLLFCRGLLCHVNLIPLNPVAGSRAVRSDPRSVNRFYRALNDAGVEASVRVERGADIEAACGQLMWRAKKKDVGA